MDCIAVEHCTYSIPFEIPLNVSLKTETRREEKAGVEVDDQNEGNRYRGATHLQVSCDFPEARYAPG
jgi:hypothetical protein